MTSLMNVKAATVPGRLNATDILVEAGQLIALIGPNGSGKTSLLRACAAIDGSATALEVAGEDLRTVPPPAGRACSATCRLPGMLFGQSQSVTSSALGFPIPQATGSRRCLIF